MNSLLTFYVWYCLREKKKKIGLQRVHVSTRRSCMFILGNFTLTLMLEVEIALLFLLDISIIFSVYEKCMNETMLSFIIWYWNLLVKLRGEVCYICVALSVLNGISHGTKFA